MSFKEKVKWTVTSPWSNNKESKCKLWSSLFKTVKQNLLPPHTQIAQKTCRNGTQSAPKVTPHDGSFTIPPTDRWGDQLTSRTGYVSCSPGVLNGPVPRQMGAERPRRRLLWQKMGGALLGVTTEQQRGKEQTEMANVLHCGWTV